MIASKRKSKARNLFHDHPLMQKGGVHEKTKKSMRRIEKQKLKKEWCSLMIFNQVLFNNITLMGL